MKNKAKLSPHMVFHGPFPLLVTFPFTLPLPEILKNKKGEYKNIPNKGPTTCANFLLGGTKNYYAPDGTHVI